MTSPGYATAMVILLQVLIPPVDYITDFNPYILGDNSQTNVCSNKDQFPSLLWTPHNVNVRDILRYLCIDPLFDWSYRYRERTTIFGGPLWKTLQKCEL